ncbi:hypothetical protein ACP70R_004533 [Stipagrostis hirtigluma subsp. patula]
MASPAPPIGSDQAQQPLPVFTDEILEDIFVRLPTPTDLARAATACRTFRRIITDRSFLRRFRAVHPSPLDPSSASPQTLGSTPHSHPTPLRLPLAHSPMPPTSPTPSSPTKSRMNPGFPATFAKFTFLSDLEFAVCDPLYRRYVLLDCIPHELTAWHERLFDAGIFLVPTSEDEEETSFRVICTAWNQTKLFAFVFSSTTGRWSIATSPSWSSLGTVAPSFGYSFSCFGYAQGCFYFKLSRRDKLFVFDAFKIEFSSINNVPPYLTLGNVLPRIVEGEEGTLLLLVLGGRNEDGSFKQCITKLNATQPSDQWQLQSTVSLPIHHHYFILGAAEGFLFLRGSLKDQNSIHPLEGFPDEEYFSLDAKTSELKRICGMKHSFYFVNPYFGFPPSLSKPCI